MEIFKKKIIIFYELVEFASLSESKYNEFIEKNWSRRDDEAALEQTKKVLLLKLRYSCKGEDWGRAEISESEQIRSYW